LIRGGEYFAALVQSDLPPDLLLGEAELSPLAGDFDSAGLDSDDFDSADFDSPDDWSDFAAFL
jgi:hypothetical protein